MDKTKPKNLYLICGDEEYLKEEKKHELLDALHADGSLNFNSFDDENIDLDEIKRLCDTLPFMEDYRKLLIASSGLFKNSSAGTSAAETFSELPETTVVIFYEKDADKSSAMYRLVAKKGEVCRYDTAASRRGREKNAVKGDIRNWVKDELKSAGRRMDGRTLQEFTELTGYNMMNLKNELEKLICYTLDRPSGAAVTLDDVRRISSKTLSDRVFDMLDAKLSGRTGDALSMLEELFALKEQPMRILYVIVRQYNLLLAYKECARLRLSDAETAAKLGIQEWLVDKLRRQSGGITLTDAVERLENCAETEYRVKQGDLPERLAVELLIAN